ncbi:MAG: hypothetical protein HYU54_02600 [Actinobacteria bacterium]|nr:hypothetical protein [Actinomycetota bacterium]
MADCSGVGGRIDSYFDTIRAMARHGALAGKPGIWVNIGARADEASRRWRRTQACHSGLHARFVEIELWGWILGVKVLPDRQETLAAAIHSIGAEEARDDLADIEALLEVVCPEPHEATGAPGRSRPSLSEFAVLRQLRDAERRGTVSALDAALRATIVLAESVGEDAEAGHPKCEPWPVLTVSHVLTRALWESMPRPHRAVLAHVAQRLFFAAYAPEEPRPGFIHQAPELQLPKDADPRWHFDPSWHYIPVTQRTEDWLDLGPDLLIEDLEVAVRQGVEEALRRQREVERRLGLLAAGQPHG